MMVFMTSPRRYCQTAREQIRSRFFGSAKLAHSIVLAGAWILYDKINYRSQSSDKSELTVFGGCLVLCRYDDHVRPSSSLFPSALVAAVGRGGSSRDGGGGGGAVGGRVRCYRAVDQEKK